MTAPSHAELKLKQRRRRERFPQDLGLRVHRAISWIGRAEREEHDPDARFLFLWIAFNAAYADEMDADDLQPGERGQFRDLLQRIVALDTPGRLHGVVWREFQGSVRTLLENRYIFRPFWLNLNAVAGHDDWERRFIREAGSVRRAMMDRDTARVLRILFDRLYVLRCQMMHGATTWNSSVTRPQVENGAAVLGALLPEMIDIMLDNPDTDWGTPHYPVIGAGITTGRRGAPADGS